MATGETYKVVIDLDVKDQQQIQNLIKELGRLEKATPKAAAATSRAMNNASKSTKRFGSTATNVSYQLQDLIVQIQSGTSAGRALSQQLPQMTVGLGPFAAIVGVAAAALAPFIVNLFKSAEEAKDLDDVLGELDSTIGNIGRTMSRLNLDSYVSEWLNASDAQREALQATMDYDTYLAKRSVNQLVDQLPGGGFQRRESVRGGARVRPTGNQDELERIGQTLGLNAEKYREIEDRVEAVRNAETRSAETIMQLRLAAMDQLDGENKLLEDYIDQLYKAEQAQRQLESIGEVRQRARDKEIEQLEEIDVISKRIYSTQKPKFTERQAEQNAFISDVSDLQRIFKDSNNNDLIEQFSLATEAVDVFGQSFDTMLDGVLMGTTDLAEGFESMVKVILVQLAKLAAYQFIANAFSGTALGNAAGSLLPSAQGNAFSGGNVIPFAKGGVVTGPTIFPMANGAGLLGEAGAEAVMPLSRTASGDLGVKAAPMNVVINNNAPGVDVSARQTDNGLTLDVVMSNLAASIERGGNPVSNSLERNYRLNRGGSLY